MFMFTILAVFVASAVAAPAQYYPPAEPPTTTLEPCPEGQERDALGECAEVEIKRNLFVYREPESEATTPEVTVPPPQVKLNLLVLKTADEEQPEPIVIPPPREKTLVLVLSKKGSNERQVIEVPAPELEEPEVFFVDYVEGENPKLPGNIYLEEALKLAETAPTTTASSSYYG